MPGVSRQNGRIQACRGSGFALFRGRTKASVLREINQDDAGFLYGFETLLGDAARLEAACSDLSLGDLAAAIEKLNEASSSANPGEGRRVSPFSNETSSAPRGDGAARSLSPASWWGNAALKRTDCHRADWADHSLSLDHRCRFFTPRTALATAYFCPISTTSLLPSRDTIGY